MSAAVAPKRPSARTRAAKQAWHTRKSATYRARKTEAGSKVALVEWAKHNKWRVVFFEGKSGAPRTGIVDAVLVRIAPRKPDTVQLRFVQLKAGSAGCTAAEVLRLKAAVAGLDADWRFAAFDGHELHWSAAGLP